MAYRFKKSDTSLEKAFRRIAVKQIDGAAKSAAKAEADDADEAIHDIRKRCKKLRGLIRLVRPSFDDYASENAFFRDAARELSPIRDAEVLITTYDNIAGAYGDQLRHAGCASIRDHLTERRETAVQACDLNKALADFQEAMEAARKRAAKWRIRGDGFPVIAAGASTTYRRAQAAMKRALKERTPENFHEWRKRAKYHWYHTRLLHPIWPEAMKTRGNVADRLGDLLGDHHDLAVLSDTVGSNEHAFGRSESASLLIKLTRRRQAVLEEEAFAIGARLFAESAPALFERLEAYWNIWRGEKRQAGKFQAAETPGWLE